MIDKFENKINAQVDYVTPVFIKSFCNNHNALCKTLMSEAANILRECGWEHEFTIYYYADWNHVRLYLRLAYVAACHIDGLWVDIKVRLPHLVPLIKSVVELRKEKDFMMLWIERQIAGLEWKKSTDPFIGNEHWINTKKYI